MSDGDYYQERARAARAAAEAAGDSQSFLAHMAIAREYEWRAATEPYSDSPALLVSEAAC